MHDEPELEHSMHCQEISSGGKAVSVEIYRMVGESSWVLEVVDEFGNSIVWDDRFSSDQKAWKVVKATIKSEGIDVLIGKSSESV